MPDSLAQIKIKKIKEVYRAFEQEINLIHKEILRLLKDYYRQEDEQKLKKLREQLK